MDVATVVASSAGLGEEVTDRTGAKAAAVDSGLVMQCWRQVNHRVGAKMYGCQMQHGTLASARRAMIS